MDHQTFIRLPLDQRIEIVTREAIAETVTAIKEAAVQRFSSESVDSIVSDIEKLKREEYLPLNRKTMPERRLKPACYHVRKHQRGSEGYRDGRPKEWLDAEIGPHEAIPLVGHLDTLPIHVDAYAHDNTPVLIAAPAWFSYSAGDILRATKSVDLQSQDTVILFHSDVTTVVYETKVRKVSVDVGCLSFA